MMGDWKRRSISKKTKASRESGKKKGLCPPAWARYCAKASKGYKHPLYSKWNEMCNGNKVKWSSS